MTNFLLPPVFSYASIDSLSLFFTATHFTNMLYGNTRM